MSKKLPQSVDFSSVYLTASRCASGINSATQVSCSDKTNLFFTIKRQCFGHGIQFVFPIVYFVTNVVQIYRVFYNNFRFSATSANCLTNLVQYIRPFKSPVNICKTNVNVTIVKPTHIISSYFCYILLNQYVNKFQ